jgi:TRAP-type mannitol/chloroaromatic compound transport system substrate-binding protein
MNTRPPMLATWIADEPDRVDHQETKERSMKRRTFLRTGALAATAAATGLATPAIAQGRRELKMVTSWPKNLPGLGVGAERLAKKITDLTDGQLRVRVYAAGELVPPFQAFDAVSGGTAEMYHSASFLYLGKHQAFAFFSTMPFGLTSVESNGWLYFGGGQELWDELSARYNLKPFSVGNAGVSMFGWMRREIKTLDDFRGLKYRMAGVVGEIMRRMGVAVVNLPPSELFAALQSGAIDGAEWASPFIDIGLGFHRVAKYYYYPGIHEPGTTIDMSINLAVWNSLTKFQQEAIRAAAAWENDVMLAEFVARNGPALKALIEKHGVQVRRFSNEIIKEMAKNAEEIVAEMMAADPMTKKIGDSYYAFRAQALEWSNHSETAYLDARRIALSN